MSFAMFPFFYVNTTVLTGFEIAR